MQSNIWTLLTFIILPNGELDGNHLTYLFDSKTKCKEYLQSKYQSSANKIAPNVSETVEQVDVSSIPTGTLNQSDVSQLAKSGNIDITEAIAARRT